MSCHCVSVESGICPAAPLALLAHVEDLEVRLAADAGGEVVQRDAFDAFYRALLLAPARHAAVQEAGELADPDADGELAGVAAVGVVAADEDGLLLAVGEPGEL
jgi:hypothetical protein